MHDCHYSTCEERIKKFVIEGKRKKILPMPVRILFYENSIHMKVSNADDCPVGLSY